MLRVTVDVNGRPIGRIAAVRTTEGKGENNYEIYDVTDVDAGQSVVEHGTLITEITHTYNDGAAVLVQKMMSEVESLD